MPFSRPSSWPFSDVNIFVSGNGQPTASATGEVTAMSFRDLHFHGEPLVLPNAWDAASARIIEQAGAVAVATTSAGVAWSLGAPDGNRLRREDAIAAVARIVRAVDVPVTADIESGYGDVGATVRDVVAAGAVGINIEDGAHRQVQRIVDARAAAGDALFINARIDTFLFGDGDLDETVSRAAAYLDAGADGIFVPGMVEPGVVAELVERIPAPLNIMAGPGAPSVAELGKLGVRRISVGPAITVAAYEATARAAAELLAHGTYDLTAVELTHGDLNAAFAH
jgi:2-methylisocitrate lyase-like PEP mutase family enzyme